MIGGGGGQLALNQLLVVMDGIDNPPFFKRICHEPHQHVPRRDLRRAAPDPRALDAAPAAEAARRTRSTSSAPRTCPMEHARSRADPAGPDGPPRLVPHADEGATGSTSSTSTWPRSRTTADLDTEKRRDELARITNGYSPAMIEQVCSMALTYRPPRRAARRSAGSDIVEAMTTVESGTAIGDRVRRRRRRVRWRSTRPATRPPRTST